jgi:hypothetical protein
MSVYQRYVSKGIKLDGKPLSITLLEPQPPNVRPRAIKISKCKPFTPEKLTLFFESQRHGGPLPKVYAKGGEETILRFTKDEGAYL